jgi:hypothetical protein
VLQNGSDNDTEQGRKRRPCIHVNWRALSSACLFVLLNEGGDELGHEVLLAPGQNESLLENSLQLADRARTSQLDGLIAEDVLDADAESLGESGEHV